MHKKKALAVSSGRSPFRPASDGMSSTLVAPSNAPTKKSDNSEQPRPRESDTRRNVPTRWSARRTIRNVYNHFLFGIPFLYQNRVQRIIDTAHLSGNDLKLLMALNARNRNHTRRRRELKDWLSAIDTLEDWESLIGDFPPWSMKLKLNPNPDEVTPERMRQTIPLPNTNGNAGGGKLVLTAALETFHEEWKTFIKSASYEWTNLNIVSALMLTYVYNLAYLRLYHV